MFEYFSDADWSSGVVVLFWAVFWGLKALARINRQPARAEQYVDLAAAENHIRKELRKAERKRHPDDLEISMALNRLGDVLMRKRDFAEAESAYRRALLAEQKVLGLYSPDLVVTLR